LNGKLTMGGAHHLHPEREKHVRYYQIDDEKRQVDEKTDGEGLAELGHDESGDGDAAVVVVIICALRLGPSTPGYHAETGTFATVRVCDEKNPS
jgi:hypothetical protein